MNKNIKSMIVYIIIIIAIICGLILFNNYKEKLLYKIIQDNLYRYFKENNNHVASKDFELENIVIKCRGDNAYFVEFNLVFDDTSESINKLGAVVYKDLNTWNVRGFSSGIRPSELKDYNFMCLE